MSQLVSIYSVACCESKLNCGPVIPPYLYGPFARLFQPISPGDWTPFSTNIFIVNLLSPTGKYPRAPPYLDIRDTARAHIEAFKAPPNIQGRKRILIASPHVVVYKDLLEMIKEARPRAQGAIDTDAHSRFSNWQP